MLIAETYENETAGYQYGSSEPYEPYTDNVGELFRSLQREYGRCTSRVYIDRPDGTVKPVGWVFESKCEYEDWHRCKRGERYYTRHVWVRVWPGDVFLCQRCKLVHPVADVAEQTHHGELCSHCAHGHYAAEPITKEA